MKKIYILTLNGYHNYGNRLQNFALQQVLEDFKFNVTTVRVERKSSTKITDKLLKLLDFKLIFKKIIIHKNRKLLNEKIKKFKIFSKIHLCESDFVVSSTDHFKRVSAETDYFVVGSDQVWNPNTLHGTEYYFTPFTANKQNIPYAPSFGVKTLSSEQIEKYKKWLSNFEHLSVIEEAGQKIIEDLLGIEVPVLVDPTLLLTKDAWLKISKPHDHKPNKKYLLT